MKIEKIDVFNDVVDTASNLIGEGDILNFVSDNTPGLRLLVRSFNSISDNIFNMKLDNFIEHANNFTTDYKFEKFKSRINDDDTYKSKVSRYVVFKINKFDVDYKLKIFSHACTDFFNSNITENTLIEISEVIDNLNTADIEIIKCLSRYNSDLVQIKMVVDELLDKIDDFKIYSSILKLTNYSIVLEESQPTWDGLKDKHLKQICLSPFGGTLHKYL